jgi:hypothetical protein
LNFELRGVAWSLLQVLPKTPAVGERLRVDRGTLIVSQVELAPPGSSVSASIRAEFEDPESPVTNDIGT